jgi:uncharacterized protein (TIGR02391 family)
LHRSLETTPSFRPQIRPSSTLGTDAEELYATVFGGKATEPLVTVTAFLTESEKSEQRGFKNLLTGIHGHCRSPRAHATRRGSDEDKQDFLEAFALFSYVHRRLDRAGVTQ